MDLARTSATILEMAKASRTARGTRDAQRRKRLYPYYGLKPCLKVGQAVRDGGGDRVAVPKSVVAAGVEMDQNASAFAQLVSSAKCFGIVDGYTELTLTDYGRDYFFPTTNTASRAAELAFLSQPPVFEFLIAKFDGGVVPSPNHLGNLLAREFHIGAGWSVRVAQIFVLTAAELGVVDSSGCLRYRAAIHLVGNPTGTSATSQISPTNVTTVTTTTMPPSQVGVAFSTPTPPLAAARGTNSVWVWGGIRLETPDDLTMQMWERLQKYVEILRPDEPAQGG